MADLGIRTLPCSVMKTMVDSNDTLVKLITHLCPVGPDIRHTQHQLIYILLVAVAGRTFYKLVPT
jgi:hypothetical protein